MHERVARIVHHVVQVLLAPGIGQLVERGDVPVGMRLQRVADEVAADEPGAAGDENCIVLPLDPHLGVVAEHEAIRRRLERQAMNLHAPADQAVGDARLEIVNQRSFEHDAVLDLRLADLDVACRST